LASAKAEEEKRPMEKMLNTLKERERQQECSRKLKFIFGDIRRGVTFVEVPLDNGDWKLVTSKVIIEKGCIDENIRGFTQASDTPALVQNQIDLLGRTANSDTSHVILDGTINPNLDSEIQSLAPFLTMPEKVRVSNHLKVTISTEEYWREWKKCKEYTSSGMSLLHFGHFKASCLVPKKLEVDVKIYELYYVLLCSVLSNMELSRATH
jgi:hypothetical protein